MGHEDRGISSFHKDDDIYAVSLAWGTMQDLPYFMEEHEVEHLQGDKEVYCIQNYYLCIAHSFLIIMLSFLITHVHKPILFPPTQKQSIQLLNYENNSF